MMTLHENELLFQQLLEETQKHTGIALPYVEKDYWVTYAVQKLFSSPQKEKIAFKGGTALAKCYHAINRFSEDIDIALAFKEGDSRSLRRSTMRRISKTISKIFPEIEDPYTRKEEIIRTTAHAYGDLTKKEGLGQVKGYIKLEVTQMGSYEPSQISTMQSYITDYLEEIGDQTTLEKYSLKAFPVRVLGLERTLCEKISCLNLYSRAMKPYEALGNRIRHIFDLHALTQLKKIRAYMATDAFDTMMLTVKKEEEKNYQHNNLKLVFPPSKASIFSQSLQTLKAIPAKSKSAFNRMLIDSQLPSNESLANSLSQIHQALQKITWHTPEEKKEGWVDRMYRKINVHLPYDGVYTSIVIAKDHASIANKKQTGTLYIFPVDSEERRLSRLMELAKRDGLPIKVTEGYTKAYPAQVDLLKRLVKEYGVRVENTNE